MNFQTLKGMIENLVKSFACPMCSSQIKENNVDIIGAAGSTVNIDIECPSCKKHALIKAELAYSDASNLNIPKEKLEAMKEMLRSISGTLISDGEAIDQIEPEEQNLINDQHIVELSQSLKNKKLSASDLFGETQK